MRAVANRDLSHPDTRCEQRLHNAHERNAGSLAHVGEGTREAADALDLLRIVNGRVGWFLFRPGRMGVRVQTERLS